MDMEYCKKSGQIPAFGNWDYANQLPITQYFESARQAGLIRYSTTTTTTNSSSGECGGDLYITTRRRGNNLYAVNFHKPPPLKTKDNGNKRWPHVTEQKKHMIKKKVCHVSTTEPPTKQHLTSEQKQKKQRNTASTPTTNGDGAVNHSGRKQPLATTTTTTKVVVKAVDEDLYKISPELLNSSKRKKRLGFFSRCLVPACMV